MSRTLSEQAAAAVIANVLDQELVDPYFDAGRIMSALHDAGFAVVKKPEPDHYVDGCPVWETCLISSDAGVVLDETGCERSPDDARLEAATLLAAADHAEVGR